MPFQHFGYGGGNHHPLAWLFVLVVIVLVALIVYYAIRYANRRAEGPVAAVAAAPSGPDLLGIVALRYANGEISRDEFLRKSADLGAPPGPPPAPSV